MQAAAKEWGNEQKLSCKFAVAATGREMEGAGGAGAGR